MKNKIDIEKLEENPQQLPEKAPKLSEKIPENGGRGGLDPTRFGDWEINGKCVDF